MPAKNKTKTKINKNFVTVTNRLLELIDKGTVPWRKPWHDVGYQNLITQKPYSGINPILCSLDCLVFGHSSPYYIGMTQCKDKGWSIKKGSKANWLRWGGNQTITERVKDEHGQIQEKERFIRAFKWLMVFNSDCINDRESEIKVADLIPELVPVVNTVEDEKIEAFVTSLNADIIYGGNVACHELRTGRIRMPHRHQFTSRDSYWSTLFHELCHWTKAEDKLDRPQAISTNDPIYHQEELIADLGASFLGNHFGLASTELEHHASYLQYYWTLLNQDPQIFFKAVHSAQKAANYLLELAGIELN